MAEPARFPLPTPEIHVWVAYLTARCNFACDRLRLCKRLDRRQALVNVLRRQRCNRFGRNGISGERRRGFRWHHHVLRAQKFDINRRHRLRFIRHCFGSHRRSCGLYFGWRRCNFHDGLDRWRW